MSYGNFNGLNIGRAIDPANLSGMTVEQGSGALGTTSANNLGGAIQYRSADPSDRPSLQLEQLAGAFHALRTYVRADLGLRRLAPGVGLRGYLSVANTSSDKWKGGGRRDSDFPGNRPLLFGQQGLFREAENW